MARVLKINDAGWLMAETARTPAHVGVLATFTMPEDGGDSYLEDLVTRWRHTRTFQPPFNYRLKGLGLPRWETLADQDIDLDYHLRHSAVPSPGGERELGVLVSRLHSQRLDRRYPLWECHVIEGVAEGRWSMYMKVHHSQIDGVGGIRLANRIFSVDPEARGMLPPWAVGTRGADQSGLPPATKEVQRAETGRLGVVRAAASVAGSLVSTYRESATGSGDELRAVPWRAPRSVFNRRISAPRRFATQNYDIDRVKRVAKAADGSINDVFLAICGGALRRYLLELDALPSSSLTTIVPVSVREEGVGVGNAITFLYAKLGTDVEDPLERIRVVHDSTQKGKARLPHAGGATMDAYTALLMTPFLGQAMLGVGGIGIQAANVVISNVPGMKEERYFDGSRVEEYYPLSLLFHGQALNITCVSNARTLCIGYTGCRDTVPSLQKIAVYSGEALEELEQALGLT
jgi:WS/DGAT/MGAT family acyltransferase